MFQSIRLILFVCAIRVSCIYFLKIFSFTHVLVLEKEVIAWSEEILSAWCKTFVSSIYIKFFLMSMSKKNVFICPRCSWRI